MRSDDYQRGYRQAVSDVRGGWWHIWLKSRELADDAIYAPHGLTLEQLGYTAALEELLPGLGTGLPTAIAESMQLPDLELAARLALAATLKRLRKHPQPGRVRQHLRPRKDSVKNEAVGAA